MTRCLDWPISVVQLSGDGVLQPTPARVFIIQPPENQHWLITDLSFQMDNPAAADLSVYLIHVVNRSPGTLDGTDALVQLDLLSSSELTFFPFIGAIYARVESTAGSNGFSLRGVERPRYLAWPNYLYVTVLNAPAGRACHLRGLAYQAHSDVSFAGLM